jgi:hypothetical protein
LPLAGPAPIRTIRTGTLQRDIRRDICPGTIGTSCGDIPPKG